MGKRDEPQGVWVADGPSFEFLQAGPIDLEVMDEGERGVRWSAWVRFNEAQFGIGSGRRWDRAGARFKALACAHRWLAEAQSDLPSVFDRASWLDGPAAEPEPDAWCGRSDTPLGRRPARGQVDVTCSGCGSVITLTPPHDPTGEGMR